MEEIMIYMLCGMMALIVIALGLIWVLIHVTVRFYRRFESDYEAFDPFDDLQELILKINDLSGDNLRILKKESEKMGTSRYYVLFYDLVLMDREMRWFLRGAYEALNGRINHVEYDSESISESIKNQLVEEREKNQSKEKSKTSKEDT